MDAKVEKQDIKEEELKEEPTSRKIVSKDLTTIQHPSPQPNLISYYTFIKGGRLIPQILSIPLFYELEKERVYTHQWMKIPIARSVEDVGIMEEKLTEMGRDLADIRLREEVLKEKLQEA